MQKYIRWDFQVSLKYKCIVCYSYTFHDEEDFVVCLECKDTQGKTFRFKIATWYFIVRFNSQ